MCHQEVVKCKTINGFEVLLERNHTMRAFACACSYTDMALDNLRKHLKITGEEHVLGTLNMGLCWGFEFVSNVLS